MANTTGPLRQALEDAMALDGLKMKDLTVLDVSNDPYRIDTPAGHRDGQWLATNIAELGFGNRRIHLRGLHYALIGRSKPNGETYRNIDDDWAWLQNKAADAARWLGYIPFEAIVDQRNAPPVVRVHKPTQPSAYLSVGVNVEIPDVADLVPTVSLGGFTGVQPYKLVMVGEKMSLEDVLGPLAETYSADLYLPTGEISDTLIHLMARSGAEDGRPMIVLYFADCDPAGYQMGISVARKLQAFRDLEFPGLEFQVHRVALTPEQVREHDLPSTPLKATEKRAQRWVEATGTEQTEIDALASLNPDLLRQMARTAIRRFYDTSLYRRATEIRDDWMARAQSTIDNSIDHDQLTEIRREATERLEEVREQIDAVNEALRVSVDGIDLPDVPDVPEPNIDGEGGTPPLIDSAWDFAEQCQRLIQSKAYRGQ